MIKLALDGLTSFSLVPLKLSGWLGGILLAASWLYLLGILIFQKISSLSLITFGLVNFSGLILVGLAILGLYVGRIFNASRKRPLYIVADTKEFNARINTQYQKRVNLN